MIKHILLLIFAISINCAIAQNQQKKYSQYRRNEERVRILNKDFKQNLKIFHSVKSGGLNNLLKSGKSVVWNWDTIITYDTSGVKIDRQTQILNSDCKTTIYYWDTWENNSWQNTEKLVNTFNSNGYLVTDSGWVWQDSTWIYEYSTNYIEEKNKVTCEWYDNDWNYYKDIYTFDLDSNKLTEEYLDWKNDEWVNDDRYISFFDLRGNSVRELHDVWGDNGWENFSVTTYTNTYGNNGILLSYKYFYQDIYGFYLIRKHSFTFDNNGNIQVELQQDSTHYFLENVNRNLYISDINGNSISGKSEVWINGKWQKNVYGTAGIFSQNKPIQDNIFEFPVTIGDNLYTDEYRYEANWFSCETVRIAESRIKNRDIELSVYPNPANEMLNVEFLILNNGKISLKVYDLTGREVGKFIDEVKEKGGYSFNYNISSFNSGIYFVKLTTDNVIRVVKFIRSN